MDWFCCNFTWREHYREYCFLLKIFDYLTGDFYYVFPSYFYSALLQLCQQNPYTERPRLKSLASKYEVPEMSVGDVEREVSFLVGITIKPVNFTYSWNLMLISDRVI